MLRALLFALVGLCALAGCDDEAPVDPQDAAVAIDEEAVDYRFYFMTSAQADTLEGDAQYGMVLNRRLDANELVIQLSAGGGYGGGLYLARRDTTLPAARAYDVADGNSDSLRADQWTVSYQAGLGTQLTSSGGRIVFETVTDTLIAGTFDVTLRGTVARGGIDDPLNEAQVRGRFRADRGPIGYFIGL